MVTSPITTAGLVAVGIAILWAIAEWLHARRVRRIAPLVFGPIQPGHGGSAGRASWAAAAPVLRVLSAAGLAFGLVSLLLIEPAAHGKKAIEATRLRHLVVVLDVSPSMRLADAGPDGKQTRRARAATLVRSVLARVPVEQYRVSVVAVANGALPVVEDTRDPDVLANVLDDLPLHFAFKTGKTDLFAGLAKAARIAQPWSPASTTVLVVTDGDTVPATGLPRMPESVSGVVLVGVGDAAAGRFIDGHMSRQDAATLRQVAARSGGIYHDGNTRQVPTDSLVSLGMMPRRRLIDRLGLRELAIASVVGGSLLLGLLPALLASFGTRYRPGILSSHRDGVRHSVVTTNVPRRPLACASP